MPLLEEGQNIRDTYVVERLIGEGAHAEVYRVRHRFLGRQALKILKQPGVTEADIRTLLKEAISNLLDNALNYTPSSAELPAVITARVVADPFGQVLVLQVEDSGPGIPAAERELVLQPFYRALGTNVDGSGLGLPIVNEIVKQHHGEIQIEPMQAGASMPGTRISLRFRILNA